MQEIANESMFVEFTSRTKANIIHDYIRSGIIDKFSENEKLKIGDFNNIFGINVDNKLFIRFKKMDRNFSVSSTMTRQHKKYLKQHEIDGFPSKPTFLFAGYIPNATWTSLNGIYLACWNGSYLEWYDENGKYSYEQTTIDFQPNRLNIQAVIKGDTKVAEKGRATLKIVKNIETGTNK
jgi:hypothetical protein